MFAPPIVLHNLSFSFLPFFLAGCQHLIRMLLLVIEVFRGEIKGNAHAKVLGSKQGVQMANSVVIPNSACIF